MTISSLPGLELSEIKPDIAATVHIYVCGLCLGEFNTIPLWRSHMHHVHKVSRPNIRRRPIHISTSRNSSLNQNALSASNLRRATNRSPENSSLSSDSSNSSSEVSSLAAECSSSSNDSTTSENDVTIAKSPIIDLKSNESPSNNVTTDTKNKKLIKGNELSCLSSDTSALKNGSSLSNMVYSGQSTSNFVRPTTIVVRSSSNVITASANIMVLPLNKETYSPNNTSGSKSGNLSTEGRPKSWIVVLAKPPGTSSSSLLSTATDSKTNISKETKTNDKNGQKNTEQTESNDIAPLSYKNFRLLLRKNFIASCSFSTNCPWKFETVDKMNFHTTCHSIDKDQKFQCPECKMKFETWRRCSLHLWKLHEINIDVLKCPLCLFKSHSTVIVWRHMRVHKKWRPLVLRTIRILLKKRQKLASKITAHKISPKKNRYYSEKVCDICNRKFANGKTLSKHVKTVHNKIKPFICNVCGMKTARKASLVIHMRQHTGEKPLTCKTCKFATRDPSVLHKHQLRHEKSSKFKCPVCNYSCIQTNAYKRHLRQNHPLEYKKVACDLCNFVTINTEKLTAHKEDHRRGLINNADDSMDASCSTDFKGVGKPNEKINEDCFHPLESIDSLPHEPAVDTGGVTIPAPSEESQFPFNISE